MSTPPTTRLAILLAALGCGCSTSSSGPPTEAEGGVGAPCMSTDECTGGLCAFPTDAGCNARGRCVMQDVTCTGNGPVVCACNGSPVELSCGYGAGNAPAPVPFPLPTSTSSCLGPPEMDGSADATADAAAD